MAAALGWNLLVTVVLVMLGGWLFRQYFVSYLRIFFPGRALQLALLKTGLILALILGLFLGADRFFGWLLLPGVWQKALAFLVPSLLVDALGRPVARLFDRWHGV